MAKQIAPSEASVLLTGSSGTGKEIFSRFVHDNSKRANQKFVAVNCAAIPEALLESELFGYEKGAFTGAVARRIGKFEEASNGTLLLDEISEMNIGLQAKLLRAIQEKEIDRLGGKSPIKVDTRIIATSNRNLEQCVADGTFRQDLYYRLNVINLNIPDLKDRPGDIIVLAKHFIKKYSELNELPMKDLSAEAENLLLNYLWPGNVREHKNTMHRAVLLSTGDEIETDAIMLQDKNAIKSESASNSNVGQTVATVERKLILDTLESTSWNRSTAATILGISIRTLRNKLKQYQEEGFTIPSSN
jgi:transcriptional regulator with PAS, ATPase and Fis domain